MRILLRDHPAAEPAAELDLATRLVAEHVLHQERHAAKRSAAELALVEGVDAVGIGLDDRVDRRIDRGDRRRRCRRELGRRDLPLRDEPREAQCVVTGILGELHATSGKL